MCSLFSTVSYRKLVFRLSVLSLNQNIKICLIVLCYFVLTLNKNSHIINNKLFIQILKFYVKTGFQRFFGFFKKNSFIKKSAEHSKTKEFKKRYHKKSYLRKFFKYVKYRLV